MSARARGAVSDYSKAMRLPKGASGAVVALRLALTVAAAVGVVVLLVSTFTAVIEIRVGTVVEDSISGYERHSVAVVLIAVFAALMLFGALRGARPAMLALSACGVVVLAIALIGDLPSAGETGKLGALYEDARAETGTGYYLETLGGALLLLSGGGFLLLAGAGAPDARARGAVPEPGDAQPET